MQIVKLTKEDWPIVPLIVLQKVRKQGIRFWNERTFWHEMIYKSLIPYFWQTNILK